MGKRLLGVVLVAGFLASTGCGDKKPAGKGKQETPASADPLDAAAVFVLDRLAELETRKDVTCWVSFRQLDWFLASKPFNEFATLTKIAAVKGLVRAAWAKASAGAAGPQVTAADLGALNLPAVTLGGPPDGELSGIAAELGIDDYTDYQKTAEQWRVVLAVLQDEIHAGGSPALKPLSDDGLTKLADVATVLSILLLKRAGEQATADHSELIDGAHVTGAYQAVSAELGLVNPPRSGRSLARAEVERRLQPLTKRLIAGKVTALRAFNKGAAQLPPDLNRVGRMPLTDGAVDLLVKDCQSFAHFVVAGFEPMRADNYLSDGSFARTKMERKPYLDDVQAQNTVMQLFPHDMLANGDILVRFEPNPGPVTERQLAPYEVRMLDHEMNGVRDSAVHWVVMQNVFNEKAYALDPFAAEYLSEVISMMMTLYIKRAEDIARSLGKREIDVDVARRVRDANYVMVPPRHDAMAAWGAERQAKKAAVLASVAVPLFKDVSATAGLPTKLGPFGDDVAVPGHVEGHVEPKPDKDLKDVKGHVEPDVKDVKGHVEPDVKDVKGHVEPDMKDVKGHVEPDMKDVKGHAEPDLKDVKGHFDIQKIMGGGIAVGDVNQDGYPDLFLTGEKLGRLYVNRGKAAPGVFKDATAAWGIPAGIEDGHGTLFFDLEGDGDLDLLILRSQHPSLLLRQSAPGRFEDATTALGLATHNGAHVAAVFDHDRDGDLDLYVGYYGSDQRNRGASQERNLPSLDGLNGSPNELWRQEADGRFVEVGQATGVADVGWCLAIGAADYDRDGDLDIYIANDFGANALYRNQGDGTFVDVRERTRTNDRGSGMNVSFSDVNGDGFWDVYVTNIDMFSKRIKVIFPRDESTINLDESLVKVFHYIDGNKLYVNPADPKGEQPFTSEEGVRFEPGDRGWGWDANFLDYENDGDEDLYLSNGWINGSYAGNQKNQMFLADDGTFYLADPASPEAFGGNSRSVASADFDRDGDLDLVVNNFRQAPRVFVNNQRSGHHWLQLRLRGKGKNPFAVGALVTVTAGGGRPMMRQVSVGRGYLSQDDTVLSVGLGPATTAAVSIRWPDGSEQTLPALAAGKLHAVSQP